MKKFDMPMLSVERFEVTDCVTVSGLVNFNTFAESGKGSFDYFTDFVLQNDNDTRLG